MTVSTEAVFTPPRPDCPNPEYWHSDDADSTEREVSELVAAFVRALQPELVVETGTAWGQTAHAIAAALDRNGHGRLVTHETDDHRVAYCQAMLRHLPVDVRHGSSLDWSPEPGQRIGFAWFDSLLHLRTLEFMRYAPHLAPGAIVGFHDCGPQHPLRPDVEALADAGLIRPIYLPTPRGVIFAETLNH